MIADLFVEFRCAEPLWFCDVPPMILYDRCACLRDRIIWQVKPFQIMEGARNGNAVDCTLPPRSYLGFLGFILLRWLPDELGAIRLRYSLFGIILTD